jgi:hypothetical protein
MSKSTDTPKSETPTLVRTRQYTFPDIVGGGQPTVIEATSLDEATELFKKGQAQA